MQTSPGYSKVMGRVLCIPLFCLGVIVCLGSGLLAIILYPVLLGHSIQWWRRLDNITDKVLTYFHQPYSNTLFNGSRE